MPQLDVSVFLSIIISLCVICTMVYSVIIVYLFFPFVARIKLSFIVYRKVKLINQILNF